jgi:hypothetical protein
LEQELYDKPKKSCTNDRKKTFGEHNQTRNVFKAE